jgi:hypothetical protein
VGAAGGTYEDCFEDGNEGDEVAGDGGREGHGCCCDGCGGEEMGIWGAWEVWAGLGAKRVGGIGVESESLMMAVN